MCQTNLMNQKVSLKLKNAPMSAFFEAIEKQTDFNFSFNNNVLPSGNFSYHFKNQALDFVLTQILKPHNLEYSLFQNKTIIIRKKTFVAIKRTLSGTITDAESGEKLINAIVFNARTSDYTFSNQDGYFILNLNQDSMDIEVSYVGYFTVVKKMKLTANRTVNFEMKPNLVLPKQTVRSQQFIGVEAKPDEFVLNANTLRKTPSLFGESDVLKALQLIPGVIAGNDGTVSLNIRGGGNEHNLFLLDDVPLYNPSHIYGFFSVFNTDIVKNVKLLKGGLKAEHNGRLGSVIDIRTIDGNKNYIKHKISVGLLSSKFSIDGPLTKNKKTTFMLSARRTYFDLFAKTIGLLDYLPQKSNYFFYDINAKINHSFNKNHQLSFSFYKGEDNSFIRNTFTSNNNDRAIKEKNNQSVYWGNNLFSLRYLHVFHPKVLGKLQTSYTSYIFGNRNNYEYTENSSSINVNSKYTNDFNSNLNDFITNYTLDYLPSSFLNFKVGGNYILHSFQRKIESNSNAANTNNYLSIATTTAKEMNAFVDILIKPNKRLNANIGVSLAVFDISKEFVYLPQPRLSIDYLVNENQIIHAAFQTTTQFLHLLTSSTYGIPLDLWLPSTLKAPPEFSNQYSLGYKIGFNKFSVNIEGFYKKMFNLIDYKDNANYLGSETNWEEKIVVGEGESRGIELMIEKKEGATTGWVSYTLSKATRTFEGVNNSKAFPFRFDRRHNLSVFVNHQINKKIDAFVTWTIASGARITLPEKVLYIKDPNQKDQIVYVFGDRNKYQLPVNHRMDVGVNYRKYYTKWSSILSIGLFNAYNQLNPFYVSPVVKSDGKRVFEGVSLFPILPSINYKIQF